MPSIAIVDDRYDQRQSLTRAVSLNLPEGWWAVDSAPLPDVSSYAGWLFEQEVAALLVDERLQEQAPESERHVNYDGHDVVDALRATMPTFPIFFVTSYPEEPELDERFGKVEDIITRTDFSDRPSDFAARILRSAQRYLEVNEQELADLSLCATKIAEGTATESDVIHAHALQVKLRLPFASDTIANRSDWLKEVEDKLEEMARLQADIQKFLGSKHQ